MTAAPSSSTKLKIEFAQASDPGRDPNKQVNEDSCGYVESKLGHLAVLCDGMGGHHGGQEASRRAIKTIFEQIDGAPPDTLPASALKVAVEAAARNVYELGGSPENKTRPGTTVVAMLMHDGGVDIAHVGDSRAFIIRSGQIYPLTRDHSMVQGLIDAGQLTEEQAIGHPDANKITRALGMKPEVEVELRPEPMELFAGDILLQTSDGVTDLAIGKDILRATQQALNSGGLEHACNQLVQMANDRGGHDNITVQFARVIETGPRPKTAAPTPTAVPTTPTIPESGPSSGSFGIVDPPTIPITNPLAQSALPALGVGPTAPPQSPHAQSPQAVPHPGGVAPTAHDGNPAYENAAYLNPPPISAPHVHVPPTAPGLIDPNSPTWSSGMYAGQARLANYSENAATNLPLPPGGAAPTAPAAPMGPGPTVVSASPGPVQPTQGQYGANPGYPQSLGNPYSTRPARGGIVYIITAIGIGVAVLVLVLLWLLGFLN